MKKGSKLVASSDLFLLKTFTKHDFNRTQTARDLNCGLRTLQRRLLALGIPEGDHSVRYEEIHTGYHKTVKAVEAATEKLKETLKG